MRYVVVIWWGLIAWPLMAQWGETLPAGVRGAAMGHTGLHFRDIGSAFVNPAGLAWNRDFSAQLFAPREGSLGLAVGTKLAGIFQYQGIPDFFVVRGGLAYGIKLTDRFALGAGIDYWHLRVAESGGRGLPSFHIGIQAQLMPSVRLGARLMHPASPGSFPSSVAMGFAWMPSESVHLAVEAEKDLIFPLRIRVGLEYQPAERWYARLGLQTAPVQTHAGLGWQWGGRWRLDLGFQYHWWLGWSPAAGITYKPT